MNTTDSEIIEIFSAIQGEGPIIGCRQLFLRFGQCDVKCAYCDTPLCHAPVSHGTVEQTAGARDFERFPNPVPVEQLAEWIKRLVGVEGIHHSLSLTGGEPLIHASTILALKPLLADLDLPFYLETDGHLIPQLKQVQSVIDSAGMDIKIPSSAGFPPRFDINRTFLEILIDAQIDVFVKIVVSEQTRDEELLAALQVVQDVAPATHTILQPVTPFGGRGQPPTPSRLLELDHVARLTLPHVFVIPQTHKMLNQL